jgi:hypothetical protein
MRRTMSLLLLALLVSAGCAKHDEASVGMTLDSGLDKKSAPGSIQAPEMAQTESNAAYDSQYRIASADDVAQYEVPNPPADGAGGKPNPAATSDAYDLDPRSAVERWFTPAAFAQDTKIDEKYLIRTGDISLYVTDFNAALKEVHAIAVARGGLVTDSDVRNEGDNLRSGWITIRVPNTQFTAAFNALSEVGEVISQTMGSEDVSRQYVSAVSRLKNLTLEQQTLRQMLDEALAVQRSRGLGEGYKILLDTQARLSEVTGEMQAIEDEVSQLADRITRSTIKVNLTQREQVEPEGFTWGFSATANEAWRDLLLALRGIANGVVYFFAGGFIFWLPWLLGLWLLWRAYRKFVAPRLVGAQPTVVNTEAS